MTWTVGRRITLGFGIILGLAIIPAVIGTIALQRTVAAHEAALTHQHSVVEAALRADANTGRANLAYLRYLMSGDAAFATSFESEVAAARRLYEQVDDAASTPETRAAFGEALRLVDAWHEGARASMAAMSGGRPDEARRIWDERALPARLRLGETIEAGVAAARVQGDEATEEAASAARDMGLVLLITAVLALLIGVLAAWRLNYAVTAPLRESTGVLASSAAEILAATSQQAASAAETSAAVAQTSSTVNEVAQTSEHAADRARVVADLAKRAAEIGKAGRVAVDDSIGAMDEVKTQVENIATSILALAEQAQAIGEIITTVNDVADQTNLLALNAAVEAARSGEHGRGFAVVAAEIRTLAEEAKASTVQVRQILGEIQRATNAAVLTTERGSQHVASGVRQVTEAGETIRSLAEAVAEAAQAAVQIVASAGEQSVGMSQVRQAIGNIEEATQQTVASSRQAEQAAHDLNRLGKRLLDLVGRDGLDNAPAAVRA